MKSLSQYICEASKPIKEIEVDLGVKFPSSAKFVNEMICFDLPENKYNNIYSAKGGWFNTLTKKYNKSSNNFECVESVKDESDLSWNFSTDTPNGDEKWIRKYKIVADSGNNYEMIETQVRIYGKKQDQYYVSIRKV